MVPTIATEWRGCTPGVISGMDCTRSPTLNTAGEKSSTGGGKAAAAVKINKMEKYNELILKRELTFLSSKVILSHSYFLGLLGCLFGLPFQFNAITVNLFVKKRHVTTASVIKIKAI